MRLFVFVGTGFLALCACQAPANKNASISSTTNTDTGNGVIIQNSGPRGGGYLEDSSRTKGYTDPAGKHFGYALFWTGVINKTNAPLELTIHFPADSFAMFPSDKAYIKLFLLRDTMTLDKESLYNYGVTGLRSFLDSSFNKPTMLQRKINPKEAALFFVATVSYQTGGLVRAGLVLKEKNLYYRFSIDKDSLLIPCGHIAFR